MVVNHPSGGAWPAAGGASRSPVEARVNDTLAAQTSSPEYRRRRGDLTSSRAVLDLVTFLMTRPTSDQTAQHLVLRLLRGHHTRAAVISVFAADATLNEVGMFGLSPSALDVYRNLALEEHTPMTDAVRSGEPMVMATAAEVESRYPDLGSHGLPFEPLAVWPLTLPDEYVGGIQFHFTRPPDADAFRVEVTGIAAVLALYLSMLRDVPTRQSHAWRPEESEIGPSHVGTPELRLVPGAVDPPEDNAASPIRDHLTRRQLEILTLMSTGFTNGQISCSIGFSESTVGQETLEIYRYLGVHGRRDAVRSAISRGLICAPSN